MKKYKNMTTEEILASMKKAGYLRIVGYVAAVVAFVLGLLAFYYGVLSPLSALTFCLVAVLFIRLVAKTHQARFGKVELLLLDDCDCDKYISIYEALRAEKPEKSHLDTISIAKGYFFKGDFAQAKKELDSISKEELKGSVWIPYYNVALQNYLELGEMQHAREARQEIEQRAASQKSGSPVAKIAAQLIRNADFAEAFRRKDYETARGLQENIFKNASHASQLSLLYYRMAVMEIEAGQMDEAKEHLEYVQQYAGQIFVRPYAEELLERHWGGETVQEVGQEAVSDEQENGSVEE